MAHARRRAADAPPSTTQDLYPPEPQTLEQTGLSFEAVTRFTLKGLHLAGETSGGNLASRLGLNFSVVQPSLEMLTREQFCTIVGGSMLGEPTYRYRLTEAGRTRAAHYLAQNLYVGPAPVPLAQYWTYMENFQRLTPREATQERVQAAFDDLVLSARVLDQLGPAAASGRCILLYGRPGDGKTTVARAVHRVLDGDIYIPYAISVDDDVVLVFDPVTHDLLPPLESTSNVARRAADRRWVRCRRPLLVMGGELTLDMLNVHSQGSTVHRAPVQMLANGGLLVVDDLGRQQCAPRDLLNRWVTPLETHVDHLSLHSGLKFDVPFMPFLVFTTNLHVPDLCEDALMRRIEYKIHLAGPTRDEFVRIFERCCAAEEIAYDASVVEALIARCFEPQQRAFRGCHPRDLIRQALARARYFGLPRVLTLELLEGACATYFIEEERALAPHVSIRTRRAC